MDRRLTENIKTAILVVLFLATILLLYFMWGSSLDPISLIMEPSERWIPPERDIVIPDQISLGQGDGSFLLAAGQRDALDKVLAAAEALSEKSSAFSQEIDLAQFQEAVSAYKSVALIYPLSLPLGETMQLYGSSALGKAGEGISFTRLALSAAAPDSILVSDDEAGKCCRIVFEDSCDVEALMSLIETQPEIYYTAGDLLGGKSSALLPIGLKRTGLSGSFTGQYDESAREDIAKYIFGETFNFVRRITDSFGNVTYMYGYGQKTLTFNADGSLEYRAQAQAGEDKGFGKSLEAALSFGAGFGGWGEEDGNIKYKLVSGSAYENGKSVIRSFGFSQLISGSELWSLGEPAAEVEVTDGQVTAFIRRGIVTASVQPQKDSPAAMEAANVLAANCNHIYNISTDNMLAVDSEKAFEYTAGSVTRMLPGLFAAANGQLENCWYVKTSAGTGFCFDLYGGTPLGFYSGSGKDR